MTDPRESERALLGALLSDTTALPEAAALVSAEDFFYEDHRLTWLLMRELGERGEPWDVVTLAEVAATRGPAPFGGMAKLLALPAACAGAQSWPSYARLVRERAFARRVRDLGRSLVATVENDGDANAALVAHEAGLLTLRRPDVQRDGWVRAGDTAVRLLEEYDARSADDRSGSGLSTGFRDLDWRTGGLQPSDLVLLGGRPSMGKSSCLLCFSRSVAAQGRTVGLFSLEMSREAVGTVLLCQMARVKSGRIRNTELDRWERDRLTQAAADLAALPIHVDDRTALHISELRMRARRLAAACPESAPLGMIGVDYAQLCRGTRGKGVSRTEEVGEVSMGLKQIARELRVPVVALVQLNRGLESRPIDDRRPVMADVRDSGQLEQDADVILFLFRMEVYNPTTPDRGVAEVIVAKQRLGSLGTTKLAFVGEHQLFTDLADRERAAAPPPLHAVEDEDDYGWRR